MIHNRMKRWLHITTALSLIWQQINPAYAMMQGAQDPTDEVKTRSVVSSVPFNVPANQPADLFISALKAFKDLRTVHSQLQALKETEPTCIISYARGVPEHEKTIEALIEDLKVAGINLLSSSKITIEDNKDGTTTYQYAGSVLQTPVNFVLVAGSKKLMERFESKSSSAAKLELEMLSKQALI